MEKHVMAGRPRTMAKRVAQLYDAYAAIAAELDELMPLQYREPSADYLGQTWRTATQAVVAADDYLLDLVALLEIKADRAEKRAAAAAEIEAAVGPV
jgi:hypothetical protein